MDSIPPEGIVRLGENINSWCCLAPSTSREKAMRMAVLARGLFAVAAVSLALFSLVYGDFAPGGAALPDWLPWRSGWVHVCAVLVLAAGIGLCFPRTALPSVLVIGAYLALWAVIGIPEILSQPVSIGGWYPFCEALTSLVGAWILYAMLRPALAPTAKARASGYGVRTAQILFGLTCVFYGASHFAYAKYTASMVPIWLPQPLGFAYFTGLGHIAAGIAIIVGIVAAWAATLEASMMSLFGLLVWVPSFFAHPPPQWATPPHNQWSELVVNIILAAAAWVVAASLTHNSGTATRSRAWDSR
jgi:uncharacterized membrane protein